MNKPARFSDAADQMADGMARICRLYGVSPLLGRLYTVLFLSPEPLALDALCERVGAAKSSVSVALRKLEAARVARRLPPRTDRRDFYAAVTDPWAVFSDWARLYFTPELDMFEVTGAAVREALKDAKDAPGGAAARELAARLDAFAAFSSIFRAMLTSFERKKPSARPGARRIPITIEGSP
jgi:DNA-binding transcriptional regulator GbsR (MarR family)